MKSILGSLTSSVGKKFLMGLSGLALVGFLILHLLGNLTLYDKTGVGINAYGEKLHSFGILFYVGEFALYGLFLFHIVTAISTRLQNIKGRDVKYVQVQSKGSVFSNPASRNMIISGVIIFAFLIFHLLGIRYGTYYQTTVDGKIVRDLYRTVKQELTEPLDAGIYILVTLLIFAHLRHGFWSAFQSLGAMNPKLEKPILGLGLVIAFLLAVGFLLIPLYFVLGGAR